MKSVLQAMLPLKLDQMDKVEKHRVESVMKTGASVSSYHTIKMMWKEM